MSDSKTAVKPAQPHIRDELAVADTAGSDLRQLTELELVLAGGGDTITPWP